MSGTSSLKSQALLADKEEIEGKLRTNLIVPDPPMDVPKIIMPPAVDVVLAGVDQPPRHLILNPKLERAEAHFQLLIRELLGSNYEQWVYVAHDGSWQAFSTDVEAEDAAFANGFGKKEFVVRLVFEFEADN